MQLLEAGQAETSARILYDSCPLCSGKDLRIVRRADCSQHPLYRPEIPADMTWLGCADCAHVFTEGYFDESALNLIFGRTQIGQTVGHDIEGQRAVSARMVQWIGEQADLGDWLDVGFGNGSLLFTAEEFGFRPVGIDLRKANVETLRALGYEAYCMDFADLATNGRFSVISMADVLEHMPYPKPALAAAHRLMQPDGVLFLSMPNIDNMVWRLLDANKANPYWGEIEHYHNFSR